MLNIITLNVRVLRLFILYFTRWCNDAFKVQWDMWYRNVVYDFVESDSERVFTTGQHYFVRRTKSRLTCSF